MKNKEQKYSLKIRGWKTNDDNLYFYAIISAHEVGQIISYIAALKIKIKVEIKDKLNNEK